LVYGRTKNFKTCVTRTFSSRIKIVSRTLLSAVVMCQSCSLVVVDEPPQAASDSAIIEMPPALAAFLAFLDSQALTSLLVAFIIIGYEKCVNISGSNDIILD